MSKSTESINYETELTELSSPMLECQLLSKKGVKGFIKSGKYKDLQWYAENDVEKYKKIENKYKKTTQSMNSIADEYQLQRTVFRNKIRKQGWKREQVENYKKEDTLDNEIQQEESFENYIRILDELSLEERNPKKELF